jgi:hypothetical protein
MPIKQIDLTTAPGFVIQACANCPAEHRIRLDRGGVDTKRAPFNIPEGSTLELAIDGEASPQVVTFAPGDFPNFAAVTVQQLIDKLNATLSGATATPNLSGEGVSLESDSTGPSSRVDVTGGSARAALKFPTSGPPDPGSGRPHLGRELVPGMRNLDIVVLRRCPCGGTEFLVRTWDVCDPKYAGSHFYEHRRAVNALAVHFKDQGWIDPACADEFAAETNAPADVAPGLPSSVINVPPPQPEPEG